MSKTEGATALPRRRALNPAAVLSLSWLMGLGLAIPFAHEVLFKTSFQIPGHHLEWMALVVVGRLTSNNRWAGTISGTSAAAASLLLFNFSPIVGFTYFAVGIVFDVLFRLAHQPKGIFTIAVIAGLAHLTKPLIRIPFDLFTGVPYRPLLISSWYPFGTFLVFGFIGGLTGAAIVKADRLITEGLRRRKTRRAA